MPLWQPLYLHWLNICCCRCSFLGRYICKTLIFAVADALFLTNVSATCFSSNLQILFSLPIIYKCIYILSFLVFEDASFANFVSTSHAFYNLKMLLIEIMHPQLALSITCRYIPQKLRIFNSIKSIIADTPIKMIYPQRSSSKVLLFNSSSIR